MTTLNLDQFSWLSINFAQIQITKHICEEHDSIFYNAQFILFLDNGKEEIEDDFLHDKHPVIIETEIYDSCRYCVASQAFDVLQNITSDIYTTIDLFDQEGNQIESIDIDELGCEDDEDV